MDEQKPPSEQKDADAPGEPRTGCWGGAGAVPPTLGCQVFVIVPSHPAVADSLSPGSRWGRGLGGDGQRGGGPPETPRRSLRGAGAREHGHKGTSPGRQVRTRGFRGWRGAVGAGGGFPSVSDTPCPCVVSPSHLSTPARRCALCNCGDWSPHGQRELQRFEPAPDWPEQLVGHEPPEGPGQPPPELEPVGDDLTQIGFSERVTPAQLFEPTGECGHGTGVPVPPPWVSSNPIPDAPSPQGTAGSTAGAQPGPPAWGRRRWAWPA